MLVIPKTDMWITGVCVHQQTYSVSIPVSAVLKPEIGLWIANVERVARRRCIGAITANLPASTEDVPLPEITS